MKIKATFVAVAVSLAFSGPALAQAWKPVQGRIMTRWAKDVSPEKVWPEYPRPTMVREKWMNLNGLWGYAIVKDKALPAEAAEAKILVPFSPESALSGVGRIVGPDETLWYWRKIAIPREWEGRRVILHFGAVDWHASVEVNRKNVGEHKGGYDPFSLDITDAVHPGENSLVVKVKDPTDTGGQPRGKQWLKPNGIWYTPTSGIWQTVWMEPVPRKSIARVHIESSRETGVIKVHVTDSVEEADTGMTCEVEVFDGGKSIGKARSPASPVEMKVAAARAWTPESPTLYEATVRTFLGDKSVDEVRTYFAFRDIALAKDDRGVNRLMLNGEPVFQFGPLDQGFWPDGLYTPPTEEAMKFDIEAVKKMGGNMLRKHVKVEPERFYYWCDTMGVMVWQDMPSVLFGGPDSKEGNPPATDAWKSNFEHEWFTIMKSLHAHPSIVMWVPFNEGWGQNDMEWAARVVTITKGADPSRLVNNASGWTDMKVADVHDVHDYPGPGMAPVEAGRASVLGEFGGLGLPIDGHTWVEKNNWGYVSYKSKEELTDAYVGLLKRMPMLIGQGLCAAVYTQTTDVEIECNGWLTYDREVWKVDPLRAAVAAKALYLPPPTVKVVVPRAGEGEAAKWRYTLGPPGNDWFKPGFDDSSWEQGVAGFGTKGTPGAVVGTEWNTGNIWIRRTVEVPEGGVQSPHLSIHHDEDAEVYINGELAASFKRWTTGYAIVPLNVAAAKLLKPGKNTMAIHCRQTNGGQYIDCGIVDVRAGNRP